MQSARTDEILTMHMNAWNTESGGDRQTLLRKIIQAGQAFNPAAAGKYIHEALLNKSDFG